MVLRFLIRKGLTECRKAKRKTKLCIHVDVNIYVFMDKKSIERHMTYLISKINFDMHVYVHTCYYN